VKDFVRVVQHCCRKYSLYLFVIVIALNVAPLMAQDSQPRCSSGGSQQQATWQLVDKSAGNYVCLKPGVAWGKYDQFQIEPSSYEPANSRESLKTEDAEKLTTFFDTKLHSFYKAQVPASGATLKIKPVITGVRRSRPIVNLIGFALVPVPLSYGGASVHYDLIDAASGERVGVVTGRRRGRPWNVFQSLSSLGHARLVLNGDAKRIKRDTDELPRFEGRSLPS
jgi:hypothetical protein